MIEIEYRPEWFAGGYYVYVITVIHRKNRQFHYIGQTGDRKHTSARAPFYRMMGHFNTYNLKNVANDSQLIGGLIREQLVDAPTKDRNARVCVEEAICNGTIEIKARFFKLADFDRNEHDDRRRLTEDTEKHLIALFELEGLVVLNKNKGLSRKQKVDVVAMDKARELFAEWAAGIQS